MFHQVAVSVPSSFKIQPMMVLYLKEKERRNKISFKKDAENVMLVKSLINIVKFMAEKNCARCLCHAPNQTYFCEGQEISCTKRIM